MQPHHVQQAIERLYTDSLRIPKVFGAEERRRIKKLHASETFDERDVRWLREQYITRYDEIMPGDDR